jgi:hypothetical protein
MPMKLWPTISEIECILRNERMRRVIVNSAEDAG